MREVLYILGDMTDSDIDWLLAAGTRRELEAGAVLIRAGAVVEALYFVVDGSFNVVASAASQGSAPRLATLFPGEVIGELSFLDGRLPHVDVVAGSDAAVWALPRVRLLTQISRDSAFASRLYRAIAIFLADRLRTTTRALRDPEGAEDDDGDELLDDALDTIEVARRRFEWILSQMRLT